MLTQGQLMEVDDEDFAEVSQYQWYAHRWSNTRRTEAQYMACTHGLGQKVIMAHRLIMGIVEQSELVDHKDGQTLNNRRRNLRVCSHQQNSAHKRVVQGAIPYKGVCEQRGRSGFRANITVKGRKLYLGMFRTPQEAAQAYNDAAVAYFGEFAHLNVITEE